MSSSLSLEDHRDEFGRKQRSEQRNRPRQAEGDESYYMQKLLSRKAQRESNQHHRRGQEEEEEDHSRSSGRRNRDDGGVRDKRRGSRSPSRDHYYASDYSDDGPNSRRRRRRSVSRDKDQTYSHKHHGRREPPPRHREDNDRLRHYDDRYDRRQGRFRRDEANDDDRPTDDNRPETPPVINAGDILQGRVVRMESYGAFVEFAISSNEHRRPSRGLLHISQMAPHRVEQVSDVVRMGQELYCHVLEVDRDRIRLSLVGVNTETGEYDPAVAASRAEASRQPTHAEKDEPFRARRGGGGIPAHFERRAEQRWRVFESDRNEKTWYSGAATGEDLHTLRLLWAPSPEPPDLRDEKKNSGRKRAHSSTEENSTASNDSSSSSASSSSFSSESRRRPHRRSGRKRRGRARSSRRRRSRSYSSSSSSESSSSESSSSSSSSDGSSSREDERKQPPDEILTSTSERSKDKAPAPIDDDELREAREFKVAVQGKAGADSDDDDSVGPQPLPQSNAALAGSQNKSSYGKALLPGEGQAIAQYVQQNLRVPRRGEIGYQPDEIDKYEKSGYVMSGSRHARMNAVRLRKENQVYSAEEQRALALITMEEKQQKEAALMEDFRQMLKEKQKLREASDKGHR